MAVILGEAASVSVAGHPHAVPAASGSRTIMSLQYGRGAAALLVCLFHVYGFTEKYFGVTTGGRIFEGGHSGVEFFFVLSGFIIATAHARDIGQPHRIGTFFRKRAVRILPMLYLTVVPLGVLFLTHPVYGADRALTLPKFILDLLLIPREGLLTLAPAWTLQHEFVFYLFFGLVILRPALGMGVFVAWQLACLVTVAFRLVEPDYLMPINKLLGVHNFGFALGLGVAWLYRSAYFPHLTRVLPVLSTVAIAGLIALFVGEWRSGSGVLGGPVPLTLAYLTCYAVLMTALLALPNRPRPRLDATLGLLGAASYVLYLIHEPVASIAVKVLMAGPFKAYVGPNMAYIATVAAAVVASIIVHLFVERPVTAFLTPKRRVDPARGA